MFYKTYHDAWSSEHKEFCSIGVRLETVQMLCVLFIHLTLLVFDKVKTVNARMTGTYNSSDCIPNLDLHLWL